MKKTLLCFLFLFTTVFYAQVSNIEHCAGNTSFNLTSQKTLLIGNLDPAETTVSYHLSLVDATDNLNAITNPANYISTESSKTIYARIDNNGIITTNYFNLIVDPILTANAEVVYVNCAPRIVITGSGGNSNYEYSHFGVIYTQNNVITNPSPGSQTVYVRDGNGCVASKTLVVESLSPLTWLINGTSNIGVTCQGGNDGSIQVTASGGKAPYQYSIGENGFTSSNIFKNLSVGNYAVQIKDATGCIITLNFTVRLLNTALSANPIVTNDSNSNNSGKIDLIVSGGVAPYTYSLKDNSGNLIPSQTSNPFTGLAVGSYEAIITDKHGCNFSQAINILDEATPLTTTVMVTPITCVVTTGTITINPNGGTLPYQYSIDNGNNYSNSNVFSNLAVGTYNIMVRDDESTVVSTIATIDPIKIPIITTTFKNILCHGDSNGSILVGASNGKSPNVFSINGGEYTSYNLFENLSAGNYTLSVKDSNGCVVSTTVVLENPAPITAEITYFDRSVTVKASGGYGKYDFALDGGTYRESNIFSNVTYGSHTISIRDPNNCMVTIPITVVQPVPLTASFVVDKGTVTINTTGGFLPYKYALQKETGYPIITTQSNIFTDLVNGSYKIIVTDSKGGSFGLYDVIISESALFTANATSTLITCIDLKGTVTATASGGKSPYQYSIDSTNFTNSNVFSNLTANSYTITVRDSNNFKTTAGITISSAKPVLITSQIVSEISCNGARDGVVRANALEGQPPYTYSLDGANYQSNNTFGNLSPGTHTITVLDQNGCTAIMPVTLSDPKILKSTVVVNGNTITAYTTDGTAPYYYTLQNNNGSITGPQTSEIFTNLSTGLYSLQITDARSCTLSRNDINISETPVLSATATISPISCENSKGTIIVTATGGSGSYVYSLNNNPNYGASNVFSDLSPGNYIISVRDSQNATTNFSVVITAVNPLVATTVLIKNIDCVNNAIINVTAQGGKKPYLYSLDNGQTYTENNTFTNINAGIYFVRVKDSLDCIAITNTIAIEQLIPLSISATHIDTSAFNSNDGSITVTALGGTAPYIYSLLNSSNVTILPYQSSNIFNNLATGTYSVIVKDANGCIASKTDISIINKINTLSATIDTVQATCNNPFGTINVNATGGTPPYTYSFDNGTTFSVSNVFYGSPGTYLVKVKDAENFEASTTIILNAPIPITTTAILIKAIDCTSNGIITVAATGGKAPYLYSFDGGITYVSTNTFSNALAGNYVINVKDSNDCIAITTLTLNPYTAVTATQIVTNATCAGMANGTIKIEATGGVSPYIYSLNGNLYQTSNIFNNLVAGTYNGTIKDAAGCLVTFPFTITQPTPLSLSNVVANSKTLGSSDGTITITASDGTAPYQYVLKYENGSQIIGPQSSFVFTGLSVGKYTIEVTDAAGCKVNKSGILVTSDTIFGTLMTTPITCTTLGTITINAAGGKYPHQYSFDNGTTYSSSNIASNLQPGTYIIKVKDAGGDILTLSTSLSAVNPVVATTAITSIIHCNGSNDAVIQITATGGKAPYFYSINGSPYQSSNTFSNLFAGNHIITVKDSNGCSSVMTLAIAEPTVLVSSIQVVNQTVTVNSSGGSGAYKYAISPNLNQFSTNNTFSNLAPGTYSVITSDLNGCNVMLNFVINPPAPLIENKDAITVDYKPGQTLADLIVEGQNIKWYNTPNALEGKTSKTTETPLPLTTILVNGTTYYASQTINGIESKERLAVTAKLNGSLSTPDFVLPNFKYYPNPVLHNLTISNSSIIDEVEIVSPTGQSILSKKVNSEYSEIDLSNISSGVYLLKVKSERKTKTIKIVKK